MNGQWIATAAIVAGAVLVVVLAQPFTRLRTDDRYTRFHLTRVVRYTTGLVAAFVVALVWHAFQGHATLVVGFMVAGLTFALQGVVGAVAGWFNILSGSIYRVGDRIQLAGVQGDVIDITLLRTKLLEMGSDTQSPETGTSWVHGRQYTGRIIAISNKTTFTQPVFNYSGALGFVWEEVIVPVPYSADWKQAERILQEEAGRVSAGAEAEESIRALERRYPVPRTEVEPRVFVQLTDSWMQLTARFVVPVRQARTLKSDLARRVRERLDAAGIEVASATMDVTVRSGG